MDRGKRCGGRTPGIAIAAALVLMMAGGAGALSNDGGGSWQYYKEITITNPGGALSLRTGSRSGLCE